MRRHLTYANVMATLGVFIALGGSSYAALEITGKDVRNGTLTGKDIKKRSIALNRLKGTLPAGLPGPHGPKGDKGEPGAPAPAEGVTTMSLPPSAWVSSDPELESEYSSQFTDFNSTTASGSGFATVHPQLPTTSGGRRTRVLAIRWCYASPSAQTTIEHVFVNHFRMTGGTATSVGQLEDPDPGEGPACKRYELAQPFVLEGDDYVNLRFRMGWTAIGQHVRVTAAAVEYDRLG